MKSQEKTTSAKASSKKKSKSRKSQKKKSSESSFRVDVAIYILSWQDKVMKTYSEDLAKKYINPLSEHCLKRKNREKKEEKTEQNELKEKLKNALKALTEWDTEEMDDERLYEQSKMTLGELALLSRFRTLNKLLKELTNHNDKLRLWIMKNSESLKCLSESDSHSLLNHCKQSFEAVAAIAEVFALKPIDRTQCKEEYLNIFRTDIDFKWEIIETIEMDIDDPRKYVKPMEAKINYLRHIVYILANSIINVVQSIRTPDVSVSEVAVKMSEVKGILTDLPPPYLYTTDNEMKLSQFVTKLLSNPPKGRMGGVTFTQSTEESSKKSKGGSSTKRTSKYNNPMNERKKGSKRSIKSLKSAKSISSTKTPKRSGRSKKSGRSSKKK